ncbi:MAG: MFS transporter [Caulobacterales bacterium]|nr:MFS transporter [Caulobacterales bacterium]
MPSRRDRIFGIALVLAYTVSVGQGFVLPFLPDLLERIETAEAADRADQVGLAMAAFFAGGLLTAPLWGWLSDRFGRRPVLLAGMIGFALTLALTARVNSVPGLYLFRALNGAFGVAVVPITLATVADLFPEAAERGCRFAWINAVVVFGYLSGPVLGELLSRVGWTWFFAAPALLAAAVTAPVFLLPKATPLRSTVQQALASPPGRTRLALWLAVSATAAGGLAAMEVVVAMAPEARGLTRSSVSLLFGVCSLLMLGAQLLQFLKSDTGQQAARLTTPMLALQVIALGAVSLIDGFWGLAAAISILAWSAATLLLFSSYLISRLTPASHGWGLGLQYAAAATGQFLGSTLVSGLGGARGAGALWLFALAAGLLCLAMSRIAPVPNARQ